MEIKTRTHLNRFLPPNPIVVEVGVADGQFSRDMIEIWDVGHIYLVDTWKHEDRPGDIGFDQEWHDKNKSDCLDRIRPFYKRVTILQGTSVDMARKIPDGYLDLVYLDASHDYESVKEDINTWLPKIKSGGIMAGHDYTNVAYGVQKAVLEKFGQANRIPENGADDGWWAKI